MKNTKVRKLIVFALGAYLLIINYFGGYLTLGNWKILIAVDIVALIIILVLFSSNVYLSALDIRKKKNIGIVRIILLAAFYLLIYGVLAIWVFDVLNAVSRGVKHYTGRCSVYNDRGSAIRPTKGWKGYKVLFDGKKYIAPKGNFDKNICDSEVEIYYLEGMNQVLRISQTN